METSTAVGALAALAQESRLAVFRRLVERGPDGEFPGGLADALGIAPATLSFHLKALAHAGLVEAEAAGRNIRYRANFATMRALLAYLTRNCCGGDASRCDPVPARAKRRGSAAR